MDNIRKRYVWRREVGLVVARRELARAETARTAAEKAFKEAAHEVSGLEMLRRDDYQYFDNNVCPTIAIPEHMLEAGAPFGFIKDKDLAWGNATYWRANVKDPNYGYVVTFIADEAGPVLEYKESIFHNMRCNSDAVVKDKVDAENEPLYPSGATLRYYSPGPMPNVIANRRIIIDSESFGCNRKLTVVKTPTNVISDADYYSENACEYEIINHSGHPTVIDTIVSTLIKQLNTIVSPRSQIRLKPILGRIVSVEPMCSAMTVGPISCEIFVSLSEMLIIPVV